MRLGKDGSGKDVLTSLRGLLNQANSKATNWARPVGWGAGGGNGKGKKELIC